MPPDKVRPPGGQPRGAEEKTPDDGFSGATLPPTVHKLTAKRNRSRARRTT
jgi:hypothetical protein